MKLPQKKPDMDRVSSQLTIFIRIAVPTILLTTIISLTILLAWAVQGRAQIFSNPIVWAVFLVILLGGLFFVKYILWRLYRVDMDEHNVYVSDYFKTYKYPFSDIAEIRDSKFLQGRIFIIVLKSKGSFGKEIYFLASQKLWQDFIAEHPDIFDQLQSQSRPRS